MPPTMSNRVKFFLIISWLFSGGKERHTSQHPNVFFGLRRRNIRREFFLAFYTKFERHTLQRRLLRNPSLDRVHVDYVLPKGAFMSRTGATFVQKVGLAIQDTDVIVGFKLLTIGTNVTMVMCAQGKH